MGLSVSHNAWSGGYRAFNEWRRMLGEIGQAQPVCEPTPGMKLGDWEETPDDPLAIIMAHSDCGGHVRAEHAGPLAERLREILKRQGGFTLHVPTGWDLQEFLRVTEAFAEGLEAAGSAGEPLEFH